MEIPHLVALALQADGWFFRQTIIWSKPNPMPESVRDRCTKSHEYVFLLSKSPRYFYDAEAIAEPAQDWSVGGPGVGIKTTEHYGASNGGNDGLGKIAGRYKAGDAPTTRNRRSVWTITTQPFAEAHFATMAPELAETCIKAGTSEKGCCPHCGAQWARHVERTPAESRTTDRLNGDRQDAGRTQFVGAGTKTLGWQQSCSCTAHDPVPATVLDPFGGAGTTALVADRLGRNALLIELNPAYVEIAKKRLEKDAGLFAEVAA